MCQKNKNSRLIWASAAVVGLSHVSYAANATWGSNPSNSFSFAEAAASLGLPTTPVPEPSTLTLLGLLFPLSRKRKSCLHQVG
jgi:PEP-CTERM motif-containing protein